MFVAVQDFVINIENLKYRLNKFEYKNFNLIIIE